MTDIEPAKGKLLVLTPGMGAVATTFIAGVEAVRRGLGAPIGSLTQLQTIRVGPRSDDRNPRIKDFVDITSIEDLEFAGWDVYPDNAYKAAVRAQVLKPEDLEQLKDFLSGIKSMLAAFDQAYVKRLDGSNVKKGSGRRALAEALRQDIRERMAETGAARAVMVWCGSTEVFLQPAACHQSIATFESGLDADDPGRSHRPSSTLTRRSWKASHMPTERRISLPTFQPWNSSLSNGAFVSPAKISKPARR